MLRWLTPKLKAKVQKARVNFTQCVFIGQFQEGGGNNLALWHHYHWLEWIKEQSEASNNSNNWTWLAENLQRQCSWAREKGTHSSTDERASFSITCNICCVSHRGWLRASDSASTKALLFFLPTALVWSSKMRGFHWSSNHFVKQRNIPRKNNATNSSMHTIKIKFKWLTHNAKISTPA